MLSSGSTGFRCLDVSYTCVPHLQGGSRFILEILEDLKKTQIRVILRIKIRLEDCIYLCKDVCVHLCIRGSCLFCFLPVKNSSIIVGFSGDP